MPSWAKATSLAVIGICVAVALAVAGEPPSPAPPAKARSQDDAPNLPDAPDLTKVQWLSDEPVRLGDGKTVVVVIASLRASTAIGSGGGLREQLLSELQRRVGASGGRVVELVRIEANPTKLDREGLERRAQNPAVRYTLGGDPEGAVAKSLLGAPPPGGERFFVIDQNGRVAWAASGYREAATAAHGIAGGKFDPVKMTALNARVEEAVQAINMAIEKGERAAVLAALDEAEKAAPYELARFQARRIELLGGRFKDVPAAVVAANQALDDRAGDDFGLLVQIRSTMMSSVGWLKAGSAERVAALAAAHRAAERLVDLSDRADPMELMQLAGIDAAAGDFEGAVQDQTFALGAAQGPYFNEVVRQELEKTLAEYRKKAAESAGPTGSKGP